MEVVVEKEAADSISSDKCKHGMLNVLEVPFIVEVERSEQLL